MTTALNSKDWRPITFDGETFPPTLMGISVLASVLPVEDEELCDWLWRLPICCGVIKRASSELCRSCASRARDLMLEHRPVVLAGIAERLGPHGFDADTTFTDWISALQRISELAAATDDECQWSAPEYASDPIGTPEKRERFVDFLKNHEPGNA